MILYSVSKTGVQVKSGNAKAKEKALSQFFSPIFIAETLYY